MGPDEIDALPLSAREPTGLWPPLPPPELGGPPYDDDAPFGAEEEDVKATKNDEDAKPEAPPDDEDGKTGEIARRIVKWLAEGLKRERYDEANRGATVEPVFTKAGKLDSVTLRLSDGRLYRLKVAELFVDLMSSVTTDEALPAGVGSGT